MNEQDKNLEESAARNTPEPSQEPQKNKGPEATIRDGRLKATIWRNESEKGHYYTTSFARTYEDKDGKIRDSNSFPATDLLHVAELARSAHDHVRYIKREELRDTPPKRDNVGNETHQQAAPRGKREEFINSRRQAQHQDQSPKREVQKTPPQTRSR